MLRDDARHAYRRLRSRPAMIFTAAAMLALGIGLTTAMFTVVDALILRPVPFRDAGRLEGVWMRAAHGGRGAVSPAVLDAWRRSPAFASAEGATTAVSIVETGTGPVVKASARVSPGIFDMLSVRPIRGRALDATEGRDGNDDGVLLSEDVWRSAFGADPDLVGRRITIDGGTVTVVGLMPKDFRFPAWNTMVWRPVDYSAPPPALAGQIPQAHVRPASRAPLKSAARKATHTARAADPATTRQTLAPTH